jgi:hypothetical protein
MRPKPSSERLRTSRTYKGFEAAIIADYDAETAVERELVLRLASLFWRIRRATAIETTLLGIQGEMVRNNCRLPGGAPRPAASGEPAPSITARRPTSMWATTTQF